MATRRSTPTLPSGRFFEGWYVVASVFVLLMVNAGLGFYGLSVFLNAITTEQGFSVSAVSLATSIFFLFSALTGRIVAPLIERRDIRYVVATGGVVAALGVLAISRATSLATLYLSYILFAAGVGMSGLVPGTTLVTRWFHARRSVAVSVASTGLSVGGLTITVLAERIIAARDMRGAGPWLALIYLVVVAVSLLALWPSPASRGQVPDGRVVDEAVAAEAASGVPYGVATRTPFFRFVVLAFIFAMGAQVGGIAQLAKFATERVDQSTGTIALSSIAIASVVARLLGGVVASRVSMIVMTTSLAAVQGLSLILLSQMTTRVGLVAMAILFGCTIGNLLMLQPLLLADRFGVESYPRIYAFAQLVVSGFGVALGPFVLGFLRDLYSYEVSYIVAGCLSLMAAVSFARAIPNS